MLGPKNILVSRASALVPGGVQRFSLPFNVLRGRNVQIIPHVAVACRAYVAQVSGSRGYFKLSSQAEKEDKGYGRFPEAAGRPDGRKSEWRCGRSAEKLLGPRYL